MESIETRSSHMVQCKMAVSKRIVSFLLFAVTIMLTAPTVLVLYHVLRWSLDAIAYYSDVYAFRYQMTLHQINMTVLRENLKKLSNDSTS